VAELSRNKFCEYRLQTFWCFRLEADAVGFAWTS